jgi:Rrf2 family protein
MGKEMSMVDVISIRERYAVLAGLRLALAPPDHLVSAREVAEFIGVPAKVAEQVLSGLRRTGVAVSRRGRSGGYSLARDAGLISVADVVETVHGSHGGIGRMPGAGREPEILIDPVVRRAEEAARAVLASATLADLATQTSQSAMYYI